MPIQGRDMSSYWQHLI